MQCSEELLLQNIQELRTELIAMATSRGMTDEKTIKLSQSLDKLLNKSTINCFNYEIEA